MREFTLKVNGKEYIKKDKVYLRDLAKELKIEAYLAKVDTRLRELDYYVNYDAEVEFLDLTHVESMNAYETTLRFLTIIALENLYPGVEVKFRLGVSRSTYGEIKDIMVDDALLEKLEKEMKKLIEKDQDIVRVKLSKEEAKEIYLKQGYHDKIETLKYRPEDTVNLYKCNGYYNYLFNYMLPSMGYIKDFKLIPYYPGFIILYPRSELGGKMPEFHDSVSFAKMLRAASRWSKQLNCETIANLNTHASTDSIIDLVNVCETKHNNMLAELGDKIKYDIENIRLIAIAGPSSSGKTTFSNRLRGVLMAKGIEPLKISMDDYYKPRGKAPLDENGELDLEHIEALDIDRFNRDLLNLIQGKKVTLPYFDFNKGYSVDGKTIKISKATPIIIEGIHALNEKLTSLIPRHQKFKIYISPLFEISYDNHTPISATEIRQLRRVVRDAKYRGTNVRDTFKMWPSVRKGEFRWIYPYQEEADYIFNTELTYELGVMKKYALPVLNEVPREDEYFIDANRLVKFLKLVKDIPDEYVPCNSLLREFIGGSIFYSYERKEQEDLLS